jgi:hypothetical protein
VLDVDAAGVRRRPHLLQVLAHTDAESLVVSKLMIRLPQVERADVADRHQRRVPRRLRVGEDARVQVEVVVGLRLVDVAGAATGDRLELLELDAELRCERLCGRVQLLG